MDFEFFGAQKSGPDKEVVVRRDSTVLTPENDQLLTSKLPH